MSKTKYYKKINRFYILLIFAYLFLFITSCINQNNNIRDLKTVDEKTNFRNVILIGWDGVQREHFNELLNQKKLPNIEKLINVGGIIDIDLTTGETQTKPGWSEILTGYNPSITGVYSNTDYGPIPEGYTVFERLENHFGKENIVTIFIGGKLNNIGARGPHRICINCYKRDPVKFEKTMWWEENTSAPPKEPGKERIFKQRSGEPFYYTKNNIDIYLTGLGNASNVGFEVIKSLEKFKDKRFFAFYHFEEPDEQGHVYGENSEEYSQGIIRDDYWLGMIVAKLKELGIGNETLIYITSDHGFNEGSQEHDNAPYVFLATNDQLVKRNGDRKDITPTILKRYGLNLSAISPSLQGNPLTG